MRWLGEKETHALLVVGTQTTMFLLFGEIEFCQCMNINEDLIMYMYVNKFIMF